MSDKYRVTHKSIRRVHGEDKVKGDVYEPPESELSAFSDRLEPVESDESDSDEPESDDAEPESEEDYEGDNSDSEAVEAEEEANDDDSNAVDDDTAQDWTEGVEA